MASEWQPLASSGARQVQISQLIDQGSLGRYSITVALICFLAIVFDGLDVALFGTLLPVLMKDLHMSPTEAGLLASVGHVGAVGGAILFGVAADVYGRKKLLLIGLSMFSLFTAACGIAGSVAEFAVYRFIAGFGLAGIVPIAVALVFEYTPGRYKAIVASISYMGITVGVLLSAVLVMGLLGTLGWRMILIATLAGSVLVPLGWLYLPESMALLVRQGRQQRIRQTLARLDTGYVAQAGDEYVLHEPLVQRLSLRRLFAAPYARNTVCLSLALCCLMMIAVTLTTWIAQLMVQLGHDLALGLRFILVFSISNLIATPLAGYLSQRIGFQRVLLACMPITVMAIALIGVVTSTWAALLCMFFAGFATMAATCLLLPYAVTLYPPSFRSSAMGVIYGIGRIGPVLGPVAAGMLLAGGMSVPLILVCIAVPGLLAMGAFLLVKEPN